MCNKTKFPPNTIHSHHYCFSQLYTIFKNVCMCICTHTFFVVHLLSCVWFFATPWTIARLVPLSSTISWNLLKFMFTVLIMPCNHLILCHPLLLLPSVFPSIRVFSNELTLHIRWPKYWSFSFSISPSNEYTQTHINIDIHSFIRVVFCLETWTNFLANPIVILTRCCLLFVWNAN